MPEPTITLAAIQPHVTVLERAIHRQGANSGRCKMWSGAMVAGMLLFAGGKAQMAALPWAAGVVVLLALADAGQVALARIFTEAYNRFMAKVPLNGGNALKAEEWLVLPAPTLSLREAGQVLGALGSFSVWPFYGALLALVVAFHVQTSPPSPGASHAKSAGCSAGGGCGTTGGCGSGGCGASSGKGCGCRKAGGGDTGMGRVGETARLVPSQAAGGNVQSAKGTVQTLRPNGQFPKPAPQPGNGVMQLPNRPMQFPNQPVQPGATAPQPRPAQPYPTIQAPPIQGSPGQPAFPQQPAPPVQPASPQQPGGIVVPAVPAVLGVKVPPGPPVRVPQEALPPQGPAPQIPNAGAPPAPQPPAPPAKLPDAPSPEGKPAGQP